MAKPVRRRTPGPAGPFRSPFRHRGTAGLLLILLLAGTLRLVNLGQSPPGLNQDEAANAWNARCILKTGKDQVGRSWPLLYSRCHGANRSTLLMYLLMPFQMVAGLSPLTSRLPSPLIGVAGVALTYFVGRRMFGPTTGLVAALMLALNPWHLHLCRWAHEAVLCPLLAVAGVAGLLWMGLGIDGSKPRPRLMPAMVAGFVWGVSTWAYPSTRIFAVVFFVGIVAVTWRAWIEYVRAPHGWRATAAMVLVGGVLAAPMAYYHLRHPQIMSVRLKYSAVYEPGDSAATRLFKMARRYPGHFGPDFLFVRGDFYEIQSPPGTGQLHWYMAPLLVLGLVAVLRRLRSSRAARVLLVWLLVYPVGDCVSRHMNMAGAMSMHALRSSPGVCGLILLGAVGATWAGAWLYRRHRGAALAAGGIMAVAAIGLNIRFLEVFFGPYNRQPGVYHGYHVDLLEACDWLRPRLNEVDAVFCTTVGMNMPYVIMLVGLGYDAEQWFCDIRDVRTPGQWDIYTRCGKLHFTYGRSFTPALEELRNNGRPDRAIFIVRPGELESTSPPVHEIHQPDGQPALWIYEVSL